MEYLYIQFLQFFSKFKNSIKFVTSVVMNKEVFIPDLTLGISNFVQWMNETRLGFLFT